MKPDEGCSAGPGWTEDGDRSVNHSRLKPYKRLLVLGGNVEIPEGGIFSPTQCEVITGDFIAGQKPDTRRPPLLCGLVADFTPNLGSYMYQPLM